MPQPDNIPRAHLRWLWDLLDRFPLRPGVEATVEADRFTLMIDGRRHIWLGTEMDNPVVRREVERLLSSQSPQRPDAPGWDERMFYSNRSQDS
jgi:hypothetical protein